MCGRLPASTPTASAASLDVPPVRSNFARKNATLPRLNHHKGIITDSDLLDFRFRRDFVRGIVFDTDSFSKTGIYAKDIEEQS